jgi:hypothetical protein
MTYHWVCSYINTTGATSGAGTVNPSGAPEFNPAFHWGSCYLRRYTFLEDLSEIHRPDCLLLILITRNMVIGAIIGRYFIYYYLYLWVLVWCIL